MKTIKNDCIMSLEGTPIHHERKPAKINELIKAFIFLIPRDKLSMDDCIHGASVYSSVNNVKDDNFDISDSDFKWLEDKINTFGPLIFGPNVIKVLEYIKN